MRIRCKSKYVSIITVHTANRGKKKEREQKRKVSALVVSVTNFCDIYIGRTSWPPQILLFCFYILEGFLKYILLLF